MRNRFRSPVARGIALEAVEMQPQADGSVVGTVSAAVDREARVIRGVSAMQAVEALGHGLMLDEKTLRQVADLGNAAPSGVKVRFTHPGLCADGMGRMLGRMKAFRVVGDKVVGDLHLADSASTSPEGDLAAYVMDLAEEDPAAFGMSVVVEGQAVWKMKDGSVASVERDAFTGEPIRPEDAIGDLPFLRVTALRAVDVVDEPAANRDGLFADARVAAAFSSTTSVDASEAFERLDEMRERLGLDLSKVSAFAAAYLESRGFNSGAANPAGNRPATKGADMLTAEKLAQLCEAHPTHAVDIVKMSAGGKTEGDILSALSEKRIAALSGEVEALTAKLAAKDAETKAAIAAEAAKTADVEKKLAAANADIEKLRAEAGKLDKFAKGFAQDPGADASATTPATGDDVIKNQWRAMSAVQQAEFLGDYECFAAWKKNAHKDSRAMNVAGKE